MCIRFKPTLMVTTMVTTSPLESNIHFSFLVAPPKSGGGGLILSVSNLNLKIFMKKIKDPNVSRSKYLSVVIQPKLKSDVWLRCKSNEIFTKLLLDCSFPLFTEIQYVLENLEGLAANTSRSVKAKVWAFGTETSVDTKIPHYQIYLEFDKLIRNSSVYQTLDELLANRVHIVTKKLGLISSKLKFTLFLQLKLRNITNQFGSIQNPPNKLIFVVQGNKLKSK